MSMSPEVQEEYDRILAAVAAREGYLLKEGDEWSRFMPYDYTSHIRECGIKSGVAEEDTWYEFVGTFASTHDSTMHGVKVTNVTCNCGRFTNRTVLWRVGISEAIQAVFEQFYREVKGND